MLELIYASDENGAIGMNGRLPWPRCPDDMHHFKVLTTGRICIIGRTTYEALPGPLVGRICYVLTHNRRWTDPHARRITLDQALHIPSAMVIGGAAVYDQLLPYCSVAHQTEIRGKWPADTFWRFDNYGFSRQVVKVTKTCRISRWVRGVPFPANS